MMITMVVPFQQTERVSQISAETARNFENVLADSDEIHVAAQFPGRKFRAPSLLRSAVGDIENRAASV